MNIISNVNIISENKILENKKIIYDKKIRKIIDNKEENNYSINNEINAKGLYVSAGFIDIHFHGIEGYDVMDGDLESLMKIKKKLTATGVTSFLPTTLTSNIEIIYNVLDTIKKAKEMKNKGANIIGVHLEGPFISKKYKGAHNQQFILEPNMKIINDYFDLIKIVTLAPEIKGADDFIKGCIDKDIIISLGHTNATYEQLINAIELGAKHVTHMFNGMNSFHHRKPGTIGAILDNEHIICELIADNIHVHPAVQRILLKVKSKDKIILVTDAMRATKMKNGKYILGTYEVEVINKEAFLNDGTIAGSVLTLNEALYNFKKNTNLSIYDIISMVTINPAKSLKLNTKGYIKEEYDSDMVIFDDDLNIHYTIINGKLEYKK